MLPVPNLDDRHFQDLVDDAKRLVQEKCPTWTDHNVSDPGVTLIEAFAQMVDQLIYRLNRVPDLNYIKFLELIGVELRPPAAARGAVTFWLAAPQPQAVLVRAETQVATARTDVHDPVLFATSRDLEIVPCSFAQAAMQAGGAAPANMTAPLMEASGFRCFGQRPQPGDALLVGLDKAVPSCLVTLRMECTVAGRGVIPKNPPLVWEAWTDDGWIGCEIESDGTGGLNKNGDVLVHVPDGHASSIIAGERAGWLRCRLVEALPDQPTYVAPPLINRISAFTIGGTAPTVHAETVHGELIGRSDGSPGQKFALRRRPVVPSDQPATLTVITDSGVQTWEQVLHFAQSKPLDRHFRIDPWAGEVQFGPAVRTADGGLRHFGAVPPRGAGLRLESYRTGGGRIGNVAARTVVVLKTSVPYVARVINRSPAVGGAEGETVEDAKIRGPLLLRSRGRAVTADDFEQLARDVAPDAARVHCISEPDQPSGIRVLVVPQMTGDEVGAVERGHLDPPPVMLHRIAASLDARRLVGTKLVVQPADYSWLTAVVRLSARPRYDASAVRLDVLRALYGWFDPLIGGPEGTGWPFGRAVQVHEVNAALARIPGVDMSGDVEVALYPADPTGRRGAQVQLLELPRTGLVYSYDHQVRVD